MSNDKRRYFGLTPNQLEQSCQNILYKLGHSAILCEEGKEKAPGKHETSLDLLLDGKRMDIASITVEMENYRNPLIKKNHQIGKFKRAGNNADSVCLYFHDPSLYDPEKVKEGFEKLKEPYKDKETGELKYITIRIKHIYCVINEGEGRMEVFNME